MIATCTNCPARYQLENAKIPRKTIQVRCPACQSVFALDGTKADLLEESIPETTAPDTSAPVEMTSVEEDSRQVTPEISSGSDFQDVPTPVSESPVSPASKEPAPSAPSLEVETTSSVAASVATLDEPTPDAGSHRRRRRCKEEMMARALVSDILVYNRDSRDLGLAEGNLLEALGGEIKKSWELYKEKVTPEVANSTTYFREALNEILADGESIF